MKKLLIILFCVFFITTIGMAEEPSCKNLVTDAAINIGRLNSGSSMILDSIEYLSVKNEVGSVRLHTYRVYLKDVRTDLYDGYIVVVKELADGKCLISLLSMFQYD